jgi:putative transposase
MLILILFIIACISRIISHIKYQSVNRIKQPGFFQRKCSTLSTSTLSPLQNKEPALAVAIQKSQKTAFRNKKPAWVRQEVIRLKALMPNNGCRKVADVFNRLHKHKEKRSETVSKSYVYNLIKAHHYKIRVIRQRIKHKVPKALPNNIVWSLDLTTVTDSRKKNTVFGIIDNGSRACLLLKQIQNKSSCTLLHCLLDIIERYGKPRNISTDNEAVFTSKTFRGLLWLLGISHQRTEVACHWQNGRIERFFGTFKAAISKLVVDGTTLPLRLREFRVYYNHLRPHQHLDGLTPAEVWNKQKPNRWGKRFIVAPGTGYWQAFTCRQGDIRGLKKRNIIKQKIAVYARACIQKKSVLFWPIIKPGMAIIGSYFCRI